MRSIGKPILLGLGGKRHGVAIALVAAFALLLTPALASAVPPELVHKGTFPPEINAPGGIAVVPAGLPKAGDILVVNPFRVFGGAEYRKSIERYTPSGAADNFSALGSNVIDGRRGAGGKTCAEGEAESCDETAANSGIIQTVEPLLAQIAVAPPGAAGGTAGNIYVTSYNKGRVDVFTEEGKYKGQLTAAGATSLEWPGGVAVDPSGNLYVGDYKKGLFKFTPSANPPLNSDGAELPRPALLTNPVGMAAGAGPTAGYIFVNSYGGVGTGTTFKLDATNGEGKYQLPNNEQIRGISVDPTSGHVYQAYNLGIAEWDASGAAAPTGARSETPPPAGFAGKPAQGVAANEAAGIVYATWATDTHVEIYEALPPPKFTLSVTKSGSGSGTVTSSPAGISCGATCSAEFAEGTVVTLTPTPAGGSEFKEWTGACTGTGTCEVTMSAAKSVDAKFDLIPRTLTIVKTGAGAGASTVECKFGAGSFAPCTGAQPPQPNGTAVQVKATAGATYVLKAISGTGSATGCTVLNNPCSFNIEADSSVTAEFVSANTTDSVSSFVHGNVVEATELGTNGKCADVNLGTFAPSAASATYPNNDCILTVTATGEVNTLTAEDPSSTDKGHLIQEYAPNHTGASSYFLVEPLKVDATSTLGLGGVGGGLEPLSPVTLMTYNKPVSKDNVIVEFSQLIKANESLHTGVYSKTITLTLNQTSP